MKISPTEHYKEFMDIFTEGMKTQFPQHCFYTFGSFSSSTPDFNPGISDIDGGVIMESSIVTNKTEVRALADLFTKAMEGKYFPIQLNLGDLESQLAIGATDFFNLTAQGGNPDLNPLLSTNLDLAYENYYGDGSFIAINYFKKRIRDFVGNATNLDQSFGGLTSPFLSEYGQQAQACVNAWAAAGRPQTGFPGEGGTGDCVSQQFLWVQGWAIDQHHKIGRAHV